MAGLYDVPTIARSRRRALNLDANTAGLDTGLMTAAVRGSLPVPETNLNQAIQKAKAAAGLRIGAAGTAMQLADLRDRQAERAAAANQTAFSNALNLREQQQSEAQNQATQDYRNATQDYRNATLNSAAEDRRNARLTGDLNNAVIVGGQQARTEDAKRKEANDIGLAALRTIQQQNEPVATAKPPDYTRMGDAVLNMTKQFGVDPARFYLPGKLPTDPMKMNEQGRAFIQDVQLASHNNPGLPLANIVQSVLPNYPAPPPVAPEHPGLIKRWGEAAYNSLWGGNPAASPQETPQSQGQALAPAITPAPTGSDQPDADFVQRATQALQANGTTPTPEIINTLWLHYKNQQRLAAANQPAWPLSNAPSGFDPHSYTGE